MLFCYHVIFNLTFRVHRVHKFGDIFKKCLPVIYIGALWAWYQEGCLMLIIHFLIILGHAGGHAAKLFEMLWLAHSYRPNFIYYILYTASPTPSKGHAQLSISWQGQGGPHVRLLRRKASPPLRSEEERVFQRAGNTHHRSGNFVSHFVGSTWSDRPEIRYNSKQNQAD